MRAVLYQPMMLEKITQLKDYLGKTIDGLQALEEGKGELSVSRPLIEHFPSILQSHSFIWTNRLSLDQGKNRRDSPGQ